MADDVFVPLEPAREIALHDLDVICVKHQLQIGAAKICDDVGGFVRAREKIARPVVFVDRLDQQINGRSFRHRAGAFEIFQIRFERPCAVLRRRAPRHHMDSRNTEAGRPIKRLLHRALEVVFPAVKCSEAEFALAAVRGVDAIHHKACVGQAGA